MEQVSDMARVLLVGLEPEAVDYSDPDLPPGVDAAMIRMAIDMALRQCADRGWACDSCLVRPDDSAGPQLQQALAGAAYDCVVIGAGARLPAKTLTLFETLVNVIHKGAPGAAIAFNTTPLDSAEAAARWLG
jgi:hypothetical protein